MNAKDITRRAFLKTGFGAAAGLTHLPAEYSPQRRRAVSRTSLKTLESLPTTCAMCPAGCGLLADLDGDRLVQLRGNPDHPINRGGICPKGLSALNIVYDPERILHPLKRTGPRGSDSWVKIRWDEALNLLSRRIRAATEAFPSRSLVFDTGHSDPLLSFFALQGLSASLIDRSALKNRSGDSAAATGSALPVGLEKARTILNFGANPLANHDLYLGLANRMMRAKNENGARIITFDVRMSETAAVSDTWHPLRSGTDLQLGLAMIKVILDSGFRSDAGFEPHGFPIRDLQKSLSPFTPEYASRHCGLSPETIVHAALRLTRETPSAVIFGGGVTDNIHGALTAKCLLLLNSLIDSVVASNPTGLDPETGSSLSESLGAIVDPAGVFHGDEPIPFYFAHFSNPAYEDPDCRAVAAVLGEESRLGFLTVMDTHLTETARYADLVLPAATFLESWGMVAAPPLDGQQVLGLRQPVVARVSPAEVLRSPGFDAGKLLDDVFKPRGEARDFGSICFSLAASLGGNALTPPDAADSFDFVRRSFLSRIGNGVSKDFEDFREKGLRTGDKARTSPIAFDRPWLESFIRDVSSISPANDGTVPGGRLSSEHRESFTLTTFKSNLFSRYSANSKWLREIEHENKLWINREAARKLDLELNERIRLTSEIGSLEARVLITDRIHPESVALAEGLGHRAVGRISRAEPFSSSDKDTGLLWWKQAGPGVNPLEIIPVKQALPQRGFILKDTRVTIEKIGKGKKAAAPPQEDHCE